MVILNVVDDDRAKVGARHVPVEVDLRKRGARPMVLAAVVVERATELCEEGWTAMNNQPPKSQTGADRI